MNKSSMMGLAKKYGIHIILFVIAIVTYLSMRYNIFWYDDYCYLLGAIDILQNHTYLINGAPQQYPMGYSLLIVPFIYFFGTGVQSGVYPCAIFGALTVVLLYEFTKDLLDWRAALFASLFLIFSYHWWASSRITSNVPALFFVLLSIFAAVKYVKTEKSSFVYLFYLAAGFACLIRYDSALTFVIVGLYLLLSKKTHLLKQKEIWMGIPLFFVILSPQMIYNHIYLGSPFTTGYSLGYTGPEQVFSLEYFFTSTSEVGSFQFQIISYIKYCVAGFGTLILPFFLYGIWDWIKERKREELSLILPWIAVPLVSFSFHFYHSLRYIFLIFPALLIISGHGFSKMCATSIIKKKTIKKILIVLLLVILLIPTTIFWFDTIQQRDAYVGYQKEPFIWVRENSNVNDIIISRSSLPYEYHSQRKIYSPETSHNELWKLISTHNNTYLVISDAWMDRREAASVTKQWQNETYGLTHLKTFEFESESRVSLTAKLLHNIRSKAGISFIPAKERWDIYLIVKQT